MQEKFSRLFMVLFLFASMLFATAGFAQDPPGGGPPDGGPPPDSPMQRTSPKEAAAAELKDLTKKLKLSEQQKTSIAPLLEDEHEQMNALFQDPAGSMAEMMARIKAIRESSNKKIRDLLTDDQKKQFDKISGKLGGPGEEPPDGPPPGVGPPPGEGPPGS